MVSPVQSISISPDRAGTVIRPEGTAPGSVSIAPGSIVNVIARENFQGQSGIFVQGTFVPAQLPPNIPDGARLLVQVQAAVDSILLKILDESTGKFSAKRTERTVAETLRELLPELPLDELPNLDAETIPKLPAEVRQLLENLAKENDSSELDRIFSRLAEKHIPLNPENLKDPETAKKALIELMSKNMAKQVEDAQRTLEKIAKDPLPQNILKFLETAKEQVQTLLASKIELAIVNQPPQTYQPVQAPLQNLAAGQLPAKPSAEIPRENKVLAALISTFAELTVPDNDATSEAKQLTELVKDVTRTLTKLQHEKPANPEIRATLEKIAAQIKQVITDIGPELVERAKAQSGMEYLESLRQIASTNDVLKQINSCVGILGQPALLIIPVLIDGFASNWKIAVQNPQVDPEQKKKNSGAEQFVRIGMSLPMMGLGEVGIDIAYRTKELLMSLTVPSEPIRDFIKSKFPLLEKSLKEAGFEKLTLGASAGSPANTTPQWYQEITKRTIVA